MYIDEVVNEFVRICTKKLNLCGVVQFGSSTYSKDAKDIDLLFFSKENVLKTEELISLISIIKQFEVKYKDIVFDFGSSDRKREAFYKITIVFLGLSEINIKYYPADLFFFKNLAEDKTIKILFGTNPLKGLKISLTNQHLLEMLSTELKHSLRKSLDDEPYMFESLYNLFKTFLRAMLINDKVFRKNELLANFEAKYDKSVVLPKESDRILSRNLKKEDFEEVLEFCERCLNYLVENKDK